MAISVAMPMPVLSALYRKAWAGRVKTLDAHDLRRRFVLYESNPEHYIYISSRA
jgi:hypothetical protein